MSLADALVRASPRISPRRASLLSHAIYLSVALLFPLTVACAFLFDNVLAWSAGIVYIAYDAVLLMFVVRHVPRADPIVVQRAEGRPTLGVIIAAHDEAAALPGTIAALLRQADAPDLILIADDGSTDGTEALLTGRYGLAAPAPGGLGGAGDRYPSLRWLRLARGGKAAALNVAIVHAGTEIVITVDADTQLEPGAIAAIRNAFAREPRLVAAGGIIVPVCHDRGITALLARFQSCEYVRNIVGRFAWMHAGTLLLVSGAFAAFRRQALLCVGGFDTTSLVEDYEVIHRLHRHAGEHGLDWRVRVIGDAVAHTEAPHGVVSFLRQRRRWFAGFLQTQAWNRDMTGDRRFGRLGTSLLPVKAFDTLQPVYGLTAALLLAVFAARGQVAVVAPALMLVAAKITADVVFNRFAVRAYRRLTADRAPLGFRHIGFAAMVEPFSFQLLRQAGAAWGWLAFLSGELHWGKRNRRFVAKPRDVKGAA